MHTIYGHGGHLEYVTWIILEHIDSPFIQMHSVKFDFDWPSRFREEDL